MLWSSVVWSHYVPSYCYGHDEPTVSYLSSAPGSGENASFRITLPADGPSVSQGSLYATFWFGGTVYDRDSTAGGSQAFLEFQFYPATPADTGPLSGSKDCGSDGSFYYTFSPGSNDWFACVIVWQLQPGSENAALAKPLDLANSTDAILEMHSGDHLYVNYSGVAQSITQGWTISVADTTLASGGSVTLVNDSLVLSPYYSTAEAGDTLHWGASNPGAIAFAYEIGHALNASIPQNNEYGGCYPGDGICASYWPGNWSRSGQMELELPVMGGPGSVTYPSQILFSSSQGGEAEVNDTSYSNCGGHPSTSPATNCIYPWFQYRSGSYGFTFGTSAEPNATHSYGGEYQFPATSNPITGQWNGNTEAAPWGSVAASVSPLNATVDFNRIGEVHRLSVGANGSAGGQFEEGPYWLNVTASGCTTRSTFVYLSTGAVDDVPAELSCGGAGPLSATAGASAMSGTAPLTVLFTGGVTGGSLPYTYNWSFGDGGTSPALNPSHTYSLAGHFTALFKVTDSNGDTAAASVLITVSAALTASAFANRTSGAPPLSVQFTGSASGGSPAYTYSWTFGDGGTSSSQDPAHTYATTGTYPARLNVTDSKGAHASGSVVITCAVPVPYRVEFNESGLSTGTNWTVSVQGAPRSTTGTSLQFALLNGTYPYVVSVGNSSFRPLAAHGNVTVAGSNNTVGVPFVAVTYPVTFGESTLPTGLSWSVHIAGTENSSTGSVVTFELTNGTYGYSVSAPAGFEAAPSAGMVTITGASRTVVVPFVAEMFEVSFDQVGLPAGSNWSVTFNGSPQTSASSWDNFSAPDGTYVFSVAPPAGFTSNPSAGSVPVNLANRTVPLVFSPTVYAVTFQESGLPNGSSWKITLAGFLHSGSASTVVLELTNGSYSYSVTGPEGYSAANTSGTVRVSGEPVTVAIRFNESSSSAGLSGLFGDPTFLLGLLALGLLSAGAVIYAVGARRRRRLPPSP